jgi:hypothetical protein
MDIEIVVIDGVELEAADVVNDMSAPETSSVAAARNVTTRMSAKLTEKGSDRWRS